MDQHFTFGSEQQLADVHLTIRDVFGCAVDAFGASSGTLPELLA
jgi:hypothetical protein